MIHILGVNHLGVVLYTFYLNTGYREFEKASRNDHLNGENYDKPSNFRIAFFLRQTNMLWYQPSPCTLGHRQQLLCKVVGRGRFLCVCVSRSVLRFGCHDSGCFLDVCWFFSVSFQSCSFRRNSQPYPGDGSNIYFVIFLSFVFFIFCHFSFVCHFLVVFCCFFCHFSFGLSFCVIWWKFCLCFVILVPFSQQHGKISKIV